MTQVPPFRDLPTVGQTGEHHAWDVFGAGDQLGTVNLLTPERVKQAAALISNRQGDQSEFAAEFPYYPLRRLPNGLHPPH